MKVAQSCPTLCDPSLLYSSVHALLQARILGWVTVPFSRGSFQPRDQTQVSRIAGGFCTIWTTREAHSDVKWDFNASKFPFLQAPFFCIVWDVYVLTLARSSKQDWAVSWNGSREGLLRSQPIAPLSAPFLSKMEHCSWVLKGRQYEVPPGGAPPLLKAGSLSLETRFCSHSKNRWVQHPFMYSTNILSLIFPNYGFNIWASIFFFFCHW